jgi:hypothetical protein
MKIEQFSSVDEKGPRNILATTIQGSIAWLMAQIAEGKKLSQVVVEC